MNGTGVLGAEMVLLFELGEPGSHGDTAKIGHQATQSVGAGFDLRGIALLHGGTDLRELAGNILDDIAEQFEIVSHADDDEGLELVIVQ